MHTKFVAAIFLILGLLLTQSLQAEEIKKSSVSADSISCAALRDKDSYSDEFEQFMYLLPGKDGWFFRTEQDLRMEFAFRHENKRLLVKFSEQLKSKGIDLVIAYPLLRGIGAHQYVPTSDPLAKGYNPSMALHNYKKMINELNENGMHVVGNPDNKSGSSYFLKADQHWTPAGAAEMAQAVADQVKALPSYANIPKVQYVTKELSPVTNEPSFNVVLEGLCKTKAPPEQEILTETSLVKTAQGEKDLLGDAAEPKIVLVGTSNSKKELNDPNFAGRLKEYLSADVYNAAISGGGIDDSLIAYLSSSQYKNHPPKVIIWEIPSYYDLDGGVVREMLRQFQPSVFRSCAKSIKEAKGVKLGTKNADVLKGLGTSVPDSSPYYLGIKFPQPMRKKFRLSFAFDDGSKHDVEIKASDRAYPEDGSFFYTPKVPAGAHLSSVAMSADAAVTADVSLCAFPQAE